MLNIIILARGKRVKVRRFGLWSFLKVRKTSTRKARMERIYAKKRIRVLRGIRVKELLDFKKVL